MPSQRWSTLVSGLVLTLTLLAGSPARAQFGFQGIPGSPSVSRFGLGYETGNAMESRRLVMARSEEPATAALAGSVRSPPCPAIA
jgi:hypothetical protein